MTKICCLLLFSSLAFTVYAYAPADDTTYWKSKYESALGFSQSASSNWLKGAENSVSANGLLNIYKDYKKKRISWNNYVGFAFGISKQQNPDGIKKTDDKIDILTKGGIYAWNHWDYTGFFEFKSQFAKGYAYPNDSVRVSDFMAPGYFQLSIGLNYKPVNYFSLFFSPVGARVTVVNDRYLTHRPEGAYGVTGDHNALWQVGGSVNAILKKDIFKNVNLLSKMDLFSNYRDKPENLVVNWENNIMMKVNRYLSMNISTMFIYDQKTVSAEKGLKFFNVLQFRETFGVGFAYALSN